MVAGSGLEQPCQGRFTGLQETLELLCFPFCAENLSQASPVWSAVDRSVLEGIERGLGWGLQERTGKKG